jgi:hypothetical protein
VFLGVRRSQCLPEGGHIETENFNDLVTRLHDAIEFARDAGEMTRNKAARNLWQVVYPNLSEGKPGLLGAITARAEAQVLRLSALYTLLDCSTEIGVEHQRAALALWNYSDRSARWIFSTATGDNRADRILHALRAKGPDGMTRTAIHKDVFGRNISAATLNDALELLRRSALADYRKEITEGKTRELWFYINPEQ